MWIVILVGLLALPYLSTAKTSVSYQTCCLATLISSRYDSCPFFIKRCSEGNPCQHGGTCVPFVPTRDQFKCICGDDWAGSLCQEKRRKCHPRVRLKCRHGVCANWVCVCDAGWYGTLCDKPWPDVSSDFLSNQISTFKTKVPKRNFIGIFGIEVRKFVWIHTIGATIKTSTVPIIQ